MKSKPTHKALLAKSLLVSVLLTIVIQSVNSQVIVRGKIIDSSGEPLTGATVSIVENPTKGTIADLDGNYSIEISLSSPQTLRVSYISYNSVEETVNEKDSKVIIKNFILEHSNLTLDDVTITGKATRENDSYMQRIKLKSAVNIDYISKETIRLTGDSYVDDAIKRVTGVSSTAGFISVRGLADRYIKTTINGSRIPTLDPFTNNIKLDIFPTHLVDNIVINKTLSPELPADWAGAYLSIETKDFPEKLSINVSTSIGYNSQSSFKSIVSSEKSPTDWLGFDNGFRDITFKEEPVPPTYFTATIYQQLMALGYQDKLQDLGVDAYSFNSDEIFFKLMLVELGLLAPALLYDNEAAQAAQNEYFINPEYKIQAMNILNSDAKEFGQRFSDSWLTQQYFNTLDFSQDFAIGNQINLFGRPLGFLLGLRYSSSCKTDPNSLKSTLRFLDEETGYQTTGLMNRVTAIESNSWSALLNLAYKLSPNHSFSLMMMPNFTGDNMARIDSGYTYTTQDFGFTAEIKHDKLYTERKQLIYQYQSKHYFPKSKLRLELNGSYADGLSNSPDYRTFSYAKDAISGGYRFKPTFEPERYFRELDEDIKEAKVDFEIPLLERPGITRKLKWGGYYYNHTRSSDQKYYQINGAFEDAILTPEAFSVYFNKDNLTINTLTGLTKYYTKEETVMDQSFGYNKVQAAYAMLDFDLTRAFRLTGGIRFEQTDIFADLQAYYDSDYPYNDPRRTFPSGSGSANLTDLGSQLANPSSINEGQFLPSMNLIIKPAISEQITFNIRASYSKSIARPSIREVSSYYLYDYSLANYVIGASDLKIAKIDNYDLRLESYFPTGDNISLSVFYKYFENHIELVRPSFFTWKNAPTSSAYGLELEGKKKIGNNFELMANLTYVYSITNITEKNVATGAEGDTISRPMWGQAPFVINALASYRLDRLGIVTSCSYNVQGPRLVLVIPRETLPDIYELPKHLIDVKISKTLGDHFAIEFKVRNMLGAPTVWAYDYNDFSTDYERYNYGTTYFMSLKYNL